MNRYQRIGWSLALILAFIIGSAVPAAAREPRHQARHYRQAHHAPAKHVPVVVKGQRYFFLGGTFYRKGLHGHIGVQAPLGAVIVSMPIGSHTVVVRGTRYHVYGGVYYRHVPHGYKVVKKPYMGDAYCNTDKEYEVSEKVMVIPRILNVRQGPGKRHPIVHKVYRDDILKIIGRAPGWVYVHLPYGKFGWVMTEYVTPIGPSAKG
jgi:hypothetical protein